MTLQELFNVLIEPDAELDRDIDPAKGTLIGVMSVLLTAAAGRSVPHNELAAIVISWQAKYGEVTEESVRHWFQSIPVHLRVQKIPEVFLLAAIA